MALRYDFDMVPTKVAGMFKTRGADTLVSAQLAMFRDPDTVAALRRADDVVRDFFEASGFGLDHHDSGAPGGRFPAQDEAARAAVIEKLTVNLSQYALKGADWGGFEFSKFLAALSEATPIDLPTAPIAPQPMAPPAGERWDVRTFAPSDRPAAVSDEDLRDLIAARQQAQRAKGRKMLAISILISGVALLFYVAVQLIG